MGIIAGVIAICAVIVVLVIVIATLVCYWQRRRVQVNLDGNAVSLDPAVIDVVLPSPQVHSPRYVSDCLACPETVSI